MASAFSVFVNIGAKVAGSVGASVKNVENQFAALGRNLRTRSLEANLGLSKARGNLIDAGAAGWALERALAAPIKTAIEFESAMADVRKVVDFPTPEAFSQMGRDITAMSLRLPMAANGLAAITAAAGQAGIAGNELLPFTEMAAKIGVAFDITADKAGDSLAKLRTALSMTNPQVGLLADAMNKLSNEQASSAADILDVVRSVGVQGRTFGFTAVQTSAFASAMLSAGTESDVAATSFRNMGLALTKGAAATRGQQKAFRQLGLDSTKVAKGMQKDAVGTTLNVIEKLSKLPKYMQAQVGSELFGNEARGLTNLLGNVDLLKKSLGMVAKETDYAGSATAEFDARSKTTANNIQLFKNHVEALSKSIGESLLPSLNSGMEALKPLLKGLGDFTAANPKLTAGLVGSTAAVIAFRVATVGLKYAAGFGKAAVLDLALGFWKIGAASKAIALAPLRAIRGLARAAINPLEALAGAMRVVKLAFVSTGVGALLVGLGLAGAFIYNNWDGLGAFFDSFGKSLKAAFTPESIAAVQPLIDLGKRLLSTFQSVTGEIDPAKWSAWGTAAGTATAEAVKWVSELPGKVVEMSGAFVAALASLGQQGYAAVMSYDWAGLGSAIVTTTLGCLTKPLDFGPAIASINAFVSQGAAAITNYDWAGLGVAIVSGIIAGMGSMGGAIAGKLGSMASDAAARVKSMFPGGGGSQPNAFSGWKGGGVGGLPVAGARALGGPVRTGLPYLVGERGPEIFTPPSSGRIETNTAFNRIANAGAVGRKPAMARLATAGVGGGDNRRFSAERASALVRASSAPNAAPAVKQGDINFSLTVHANGGDEHTIVRLAQSAFRSEMSRLQRQQRGLLSD